MNLKVQQQQQPSLFLHLHLYPTYHHPYHNILLSMDTPRLHYYYHHYHRLSFLYYTVYNHPRCRPSYHEDDIHISSSSSSSSLFLPLYSSPKDIISLDIPIIMETNKIPANEDDVDDVSTSSTFNKRVLFQKIQLGINSLYPPENISHRNFLSRSDGYWKYFKNPIYSNNMNNNEEKEEEEEETNIMIQSNNNILSKRIIQQQEEQQEQRRRQGSIAPRPPIQYTYGEFDDYDFFTLLLQKALNYYYYSNNNATNNNNNTHDDDDNNKKKNTNTNNNNTFVFVDLGSGAGRLCFLTAALYPYTCKSSRGIEILPQLHQYANHILQSILLLMDDGNTTTKTTTTTTNTTLDKSSTTRNTSLNHKNNNIQEKNRTLVIVHDDDYNNNKNKDKDDDTENNNNNNNKNNEVNVSHHHHLQEILKDITLDEWKNILMDYNQSLFFENEEEEEDSRNKNDEECINIYIQDKHLMTTYKDDNDDPFNDEENTKNSTITTMVDSLLLYNHLQEDDMTTCNKSKFFWNTTTMNSIEQDALLLSSSSQQQSMNTSTYIQQQDENKEEEEEDDDDDKSSYYFIPGSTWNDLIDSLTMETWNHKIMTKQQENNKEEKYLGLNMSIIYGNNNNTNDLFNDKSNHSFLQQLNDDDDDDNGRMENNFLQQEEEEQQQQHLVDENVSTLLLNHHTNHIDPSNNNNNNNTNRKEISTTTTSTLFLEKNIKQRYYLPCPYDSSSITPPYNNLYNETSITYLPLAPIEFSCASFEDPYEYLADLDIAFCFSSCLTNESMKRLAQALGRQCKPGSIVITTEFPLPCNGTIEPLEDDPTMPFGSFQFQLLEMVEGNCSVVGGKSTAYIHRIIQSLGNAYGLEKRLRPKLPLNEQAYRLVLALENGSLTNTTTFIRQVQNSLIFYGYFDELQAIKHINNNTNQNV